MNSLGQVQHTHSICEHKLITILFGLKNNPIDIFDLSHELTNLRHIITIWKYNSTTPLVFYPDGYYETLLQ